MLEVSPDASHPFIVDTEIGRVRVTGTRFNVRHDGGQMAVAVESGSVEVIAGPWWNGQRVSCRPATACAWPAAARRCASSRWTWPR